MAKNEEEQPVIEEEQEDETGVEKMVKDTLDSLGIPQHDLVEATVNQTSIDIVLKDSSDQTPTNP